MKLFYNVNSPYSRKCRIVMLEKNLQDKVDLAVSQPPHESLELWAANPLGRIPALVLDNGTALCESPVICEYMDSLSAENPLFPKDGAARFEALGIAALASGIMDCAVAVVLESRRPEEFRYAPWIARKETAVAKAIAHLAAQPLSAAPFSIGVISAVVALDYVSFRLPHIEWQKTAPELANWLGSLSVRPSFVATKPVV